MRRTYAWRNGELVELTAGQVEELPYVQDDLQEFVSPDGAVISGKRQWREHLNRTGNVELGRADLNAMAEAKIKKTAAIRETAAKHEKHVDYDAPVIDAPPSERSRLQKEILNRFAGRPVGSIGECIKAGLEVARMYGEKRK